MDQTVREAVDAFCIRHAGKVIWNRDIGFLAIVGKNFSIWLERELGNLKRNAEEAGVNLSKEDLLDGINQMFPNPDHPVNLFNSNDLCMIRGAVCGSISPEKDFAECLGVQDEKLASEVLHLLERAGMV